MATMRTLVCVSTLMWPLFISAATPVVGDEPSAAGQAGKTTEETSPMAAEPAASELVKQPAKDASVEPEADLKTQPEPLKPLPSRGESPKVENLEGNDSKPKPLTENPLESAVEGMRSVTERLQKSRTDADTRKIQEEVVSDLQKLIELAEQSQNNRNKNNSQSPPPPSPNNTGENKPPQGGRQQPKPQGVQPDAPPKPAGSQEGDGGGKATGEEQENDASRNSSDETREAAAAAEATRREALHQDVWGHLPPAVRKKLMSLGGDKVLPKYDDLARRYFESLAEQSRRSRERSGR